MLLPGTQMHLITFAFVCIELIILFYLFVHRLARPHDKISYLDIFLLLMLIVYNITGGLLPDPKLPGSFFWQNSIAYATGFMTPCYFPYYVYHAFGLKKMKFHAYRGVFLFLMLPYLLFMIVFGITGNLNEAKNLLILPVIYALWVIATLVSATKNESTENKIVPFLGLTPWVCLPVIDYFNAGQGIEAAITNTGFLLLLTQHMRRNVQQLKDEHKRLVESEEKLLGWNEKLQEEVEKRTKEIERLSTEERILEGCRQYQLTNREREIATLIYRGSSYKQIAESLFISERTVTKHVQNIFDKVKVSNKLELLNKLGIVPVN
jgi:DNA-binding CsgD family transcriptional regulator